MILPDFFFFWCLHEIAVLVIPFMASELCVILMRGLSFDKIGGRKEHSDRGNSRCKDLR